MHSLSFLLSLAPLAALARPEDKPSMTMPDMSEMPTLAPSAPVSDVLSGYYDKSIPPQVTGAVATSLASALYSYEKNLMTDPKYLSVANGVYMAAYSASATDFDVGSGADMPFTTAAWYTKGVSEGDRQAIDSYVKAYKAVETSVLGDKAVTAATATTDGSSKTTDGPTSSDSKDSPSETTVKADKSATATSSHSSNGAPAATGRVVAGLAAGVAMGLAAAL